MESPGSFAKRGTARACASFRGLAVAVSAAALLLASCRSAGAREEPAFVREITALNRRMEELFRAADLLGVADMYADDAQLLDHRGNVLTGRTEIDEYWSAIENPIDWRLEIRKIRGSDVLAYEFGTSHLVTRREGVVQTSVVDFLVLWRRDAQGAWRIALDAYWPVEQR
jgi:uncharacterized protein (TIGR02246 family)